MEVVCLILGPTLTSQPCSHAFWVLTSLHLLSFYWKWFLLFLFLIIFMELMLLLLLFVMFYCFIDKENQNNVFPKKRNDSFTPATQAEFEHVFKYLDGYHQNPDYYEQYWRQDRKENGNGGRRKEDSFIDSDKGNEEHSQVVTIETDNVHPHNPQIPLWDPLILALPCIHME